MREAVIVSTAHTPIGRANRGAFNNTDGPSLGGHAIRSAVERCGLDPQLLAAHEHIYMPMLDTAEVVAQRYGISREVQDEYALQSQQRTAAYLFEVA